MACVFAYLIIFGVQVESVLGTVCELEHCMQCTRGHCTECEYGFHGKDCTEKCQGCWLGGCEQYSGRCIQCTPGYYTESCDRPCPVNCRVSYDSHRHCNRKTGQCLEGCEAFLYWGSQCTNECSINCYASLCEQTDGTCLEGCEDGWFGRRCTKLCPNNCLHGVCSVLRGECLKGCKHGFRGRMCNISCHNCIDEVCALNELTELVSCTSGCKDGWSSDDCNQRCSRMCQHKTCERDGSCKTCRKGYYGEKCTYVCPHNCGKCEQGSGRCNDDIHNETNDGMKETKNDSTSDDNSAVKSNNSAARTPTYFPLCWAYLLTLLTFVL